MAVLSNESKDYQKEFAENTSLATCCKSQSELRDSAFNALALWSNPTWTVIKSSIHCTALSEWVQHQRIWIAVDKISIAEIIGSVKGVIPNSKLASYGDFRYDIELEEMYDIFDERCEENSLIDDWRIAFQNNRNIGCLSLESRRVEVNNKNDKQSCLKSNFSNNGKGRNRKNEKNKSKMDSSGFKEWISKCQSFLDIIRRNVSQEKSFDVWSEVLLETCTKFFSALSSNASLLKIMESDVPFITDYKQLLNEPITMLEVLSLPQPYLDENLKIKVDQEDALWLKLSSPSIKKLWGQKQNERQDKGLPKNSSSSCFDSWLGATNFLRRQRQTFTATSKEDIEIPDTEARDLIGSLFDTIDGHEAEEIEMTESEKKLANEMTSKNYFPEAHGEWTRTLFPHRVNIHNEVNINATNNGMSYQHQTDLQVLCHHIISPALPPVIFPPPLYLPPPPLPKCLQSSSNQKLSFYPPPSNQILQNYNNEKGNLMLTRDSRSLVNDAQQSLYTPSLSMQNAAGTGNFQVQQISGGYSHLQSNSTIQTNVSSIPQARLKYGMQDNARTMKHAQLYPTPFSTTKESVTDHNENFITEAMKYKMLPNISSQISTVNQGSLPHELYQRNSIQSFQSPINLDDSSKFHFSRMQNTRIYGSQFTAPKSKDAKQILEYSSVPQKLVKTKASTQHKRTPLVIYNHQRSPIIEKLRKDPSTVIKSKDLPYNPQKVFSEKLKQNEIASVENPKTLEKDLLNQNPQENGIKSSHLELSDVFEQFRLRISSQNRIIRNISLESRKNLSIFLRQNDINKVSSNNCINLRTDLINHASLKLTERKKNISKRNIRFDQYKILLLLHKALKRHCNIIGIDSINKKFWDYIKLHKEDRYLIKECLEADKCTILLNYRNKNFTFRMCKNDSRKTLRSIKNIRITGFEVCKDEDERVTSFILYLKASSNRNLNKNNVVYKGDCKFNDDQKVKDIDFYQSHEKIYYDQDSKNCIESNKNIDVELLNTMAEKLFFDSEIHANRPTSLKSEKINGWTYFKIAIQTVVKKASYILMNKRSKK